MIFYHSFIILITILFFLISSIHIRIMAISKTSCVAVTDLGQSEDCGFFIADH